MPTPTKIKLEVVKNVIRLRVTAADTARGYMDIESLPFNTGDSLPGLRKYATKYAKRFGIPFVDETAK